MQTASDFLIMRPFNALFCAIFAAFILILVIVSLILRGKSERTKQIVLVAACAFTVVCFIVYKYFLSLDTEYDREIASLGGFNWWNELPLHLCNINMLLIPIAVLCKKRTLLCFSFFLGPLGALMALVMPGIGFSGFSLLLPRMLGYYGTHFMLVIEGLAIVTFGFLRPKFSDIPRTVLAAFAIAFVVFLINVLLRRTGLSPQANYFFSIDTEGNFLLDLFRSWIPVPFLYLLPSVLILVPYMALVIGGFALAERIKRS